jgi:hypothetical protein
VDGDLGRLGQERVGSVGLAALCVSLG